ncbi:MAG TPA: hypothetical protein VIS07_16475 [Candidatus Binatia bacterium]
MKKAPRFVALAALGVALAATPVAAQTSTTTTTTTTTTRSSADLERLESAERQLAAQASATKGAAQQEILLEKRRVQMLIDALESGQRVDPREVDAAVSGPSTPF